MLMLHSISWHFVVKKTKWTKQKTCIREEQFRQRPKQVNQFSGALPFFISIYFFENGHILHVLKCLSQGPVIVLEIAPTTTTSCPLEDAQVQLERLLSLRKLEAAPLKLPPPPMKEKIGPKNCKKLAQRPMPPTAEVDIVQEDIWGYDSPLPLQWGRGRKDLVRFNRLEEDVVCLEENMISPYYISW